MNSPNQCKAFALKHPKSPSTASLQGVLATPKTHLLASNLPQGVLSADFQVGNL